MTNRLSVTVHVTGGKTNPKSVVATPVDYFISFICSAERLGERLNSLMPDKYGKVDVISCVVQT